MRRTYRKCHLFQHHQKVTAHNVTHNVCEKSLCPWVSLNACQGRGENRCYLSFPFQRGAGQRKSCWVSEKETVQIISRTSVLSVSGCPPADSYFLSVFGKFRRKNCFMGGVRVSPLEGLVFEAQICHDLCGCWGWGGFRIGVDC